MVLKRMQNLSVKGRRGEEEMCAGDNWRRKVRGKGRAEESGMEGREGCVSSSNLVTPQGIATFLDFSGA